MKNKFIFSLVIFPILALSTLTSCGGETCSHEFGEWFADKETGCHYHVCEKCGDTETEHHVFNENGIVLKEATCKEEGILSYECDICHYTKEEIIPKSNNHKFDEIISHDEKNHTIKCSSCGLTVSEGHTFDVKYPVAEFLKESATCEKKAVYYTSCKCGLSSKGTAGEQTFESGDYASHELTALAIKSLPNKRTYAAFETFDPTGLVLSYSCMHCKKTNLEATVKDGITFNYQSGNTSFRVGETIITANFGGRSVDIPGFVVTKNTNEIYGLEDVNTTCGQLIDLNVVTCKLGTVNIKVTDKNGADVSNKENIYEVYEELAPYKVEAKVEGTSQFDEVPTKVAHINVKHLYTTDNDEGISKCGCEKLAVDKFFYNTDTKSLFTDGVIGEKADIALNGTIIDPSTGKEPDYSLLNPFDIMKVTSTKGDESVTFYITAISKVVTTAKELNDNLWAKEKDVNGYFVLGNDIEEWTTNAMEGNNGSGGGKVKVTLDGLGHHIKKFVAGSKHGGIFGSRYLTGSIFTDLHFDSVKCLAEDGGIFGYVGDSLCIKNSSFILDSEKSALFSGVLAYADNRIINCVINFKDNNNVWLMSSKGNSSDKLTFIGTTIYYTVDKTQNIFRNIDTKHDEEGITWVLN